MKVHSCDADCPTCLEILQRSCDHEFTVVEFDGGYFEVCSKCGALKTKETK